MKEHFQQTVELMRKHVLKNLDIIKSNENHIREVLNWPASPERTQELNKGYQLSKTLLAENNDFINLQVSIMNFLNKHQDSLDTTEVQVSSAGTIIQAVKGLSREDCFKQTVENMLSFNQSHPYYSDETFFNDLLLHYQNNEQYEMCAALLSGRK
jgi:hypothetical protein